MLQVILTVVVDQDLEVADEVKGSLGHKPPHDLRGILTDATIAVEAVDNAVDEGGREAFSKLQRVKLDEADVAGDLERLSLQVNELREVLLVALPQLHDLLPVLTRCLLNFDQPLSSAGSEDRLPACEASQVFCDRRSVVDEEGLVRPWLTEHTLV